jgi:carbon storage regulator CsrA
MLVLTRRPNDKIVFPTIDTIVQIISLKSGHVRLGIEAPPHVPIYRAELLDRVGIQELAEPGQHVSAARLRELRHFIKNRINSSTIGLALLRKQLERGLTADMLDTMKRLERETAALQQGVEEATATLAPRLAPAVRKRALLVEDDGNERELLAGFLRLAGLEVDTAGDGADALDHLRRDRPDVVLLDMLLPRCDGPSVVRALRQDPSYAGLKIFGVTGVDYEKFGLACGPGGIDRWFRKPLNPEALLQELNRDLTPPAG